MRTWRASVVLIATAATVACGGPMPAADGTTDVAADSASDANSDAGADVGEGGPNDGSGGCESMTRTFFTWDLTTMPPPTVERMTRCRAMSDHAIVWSTDDVWPTAVSPARAAAVVRAFDIATPADPARGIYAIETSVFGTGPDVDMDPHVSIFYSNMGTFRGFSFDGFFRAIDETADDPSSNRTEMLHLDAVPNDPAGEYMLGVVAHEYVHLLAHEYGGEDVWLSETLAEAGMVLCGYLGDLRIAQSFAARPTAPLVANTAGVNYGPLFLFATYIVERYGAPFVGEIARNRARGIPTVEQALTAHSGPSFREFFGTWTVANLVDRRDSVYGYNAFDISTEASARTTVAGAPYASRANPWAADYVVIDVPGGTTMVGVSFNAAMFANVVMHAVAYDRAARAMATITAQPITSAATTFDVTVPTGATRVVLVVANAATAPADFMLTMTPR